MSFTVSSRKGQRVENAISNARTYLNKQVSIISREVSRVKTDLIGQINTVKTDLEELTVKVNDVETEIDSHEHGGNGGGGDNNLEQLQKDVECIKEILNNLLNINIDDTNCCSSP